MLFLSFKSVAVCSCTALLHNVVLHYSTVCVGLHTTSFVHKAVTSVYKCTTLSETSLLHPWGNSKSYGSEKK